MQGAIGVVATRPMNCSRCEWGIVERPARAIFRAQPSVSMSIKSLEEELREVLIDRSAREVCLTPAGETLLELSVPLLDRWETLGNDVLESVGSEPCRSLRIGAGEAVIQYLLPSAVGEFRKKFPAVEVKIRHQSRRESIEERWTPSFGQVESTSPFDGCRRSLRISNTIGCSRPTAC